MPVAAGDPERSGGLCGRWPVSGRVPPPRVSLTPYSAFVQLLRVIRWDNDRSLTVADLESPLADG